MRKLVTVQAITSLTPIKGADRIEAAKVLGWNVVVGKGEFQVGDKVAYLEIDSFLRGDNPIFEQFQNRGLKTIALDGVDVTGHVLRTMKLRGVISQGLILSLEKLGYTPDHINELAFGDDITDALGVVKWEAPLPVGNGQIIGVFDTRFSPKTDSLRLQSLTDSWELIKTVAWAPTVKVDGTSQTLINDNGKIRIFGRNWELSQEAAGIKLAKQMGLTEAVLPGMAVQFELVGPGIQGNKLKLQTQKVIVFALWQDGRKVARSEWPQAILEHATPILGDEFLPKNFTTADELVEFVNGLRGCITRDVADEGVVFHPVDPEDMPAELASALDRNGNFKVINNKFLIKHGE